MITVFEIPGTNVQASITGQYQYIPPETWQQNPFYQGLDPSAFDYVFVQGHINNIKPLLPSVTQGVTILTDLINSTPGKFAIIGTSQGALVSSLVFKKLMSGEINRLADCVGIFHFGNPARQSGRAFPGATSVAPGAGVASTTYRLSNTTDLVWEFANPGDPVCCNTGPTAAARTATFDNLMTSWDGNFDSLSDIFAIANDIVGMFSFAVLSGPEMLIYHNNYDSLKFIAGDDRTGQQIVVDYLNTLVAPVYRSDGWATTLTLPTA